MSSAVANHGHFTARTSWGDVAVPITQLATIFGIEGFAAHRQLSPHGFVAERFVVSHMATGRKMPGYPMYTAPQAIKSCIATLGVRKKSRAEIEARIKELTA